MAKLPDRHLPFPASASDWERDRKHTKVVEGGRSVGKLNTKVSIVTGAARGLERAYAKRLAGSGAKVAVADLDSFGGIADFALPRGFDLDQ